MNRTNRTQRIKRLTLLIVLPLLALTSPSSAELLVYEGFAYPSGALTGQNGGIGWEAAWGTTTPPISNTGRGSVNSTSISYGTLATTGGQLVMSTSFAGNNLRDLNTPFGGAGSDLWMSILISAGNSGSTVFSLYNSGSRMLSLGPYASTGYLVDYSGGIDAPVATRTSHDFGIGSGSGRHFMVVRLNMNTGGVPVYTAWIDPDFASLGVGTAPTGGTPFVVNTGTQNFTFDRVEFDRGGTPPGQFSSTSFLDELRIGTSWVDVAPIPEPASTGLLLAGVATAGMLRRPRTRGE